MRRDLVQSYERCASVISRSLDSLDAPTAADRLCWQWMNGHFTVLVEESLIDDGDEAERLRAKARPEKSFAEPREQEQASS